MSRYKKSMMSQRNSRYPSVCAYNAERFLGSEQSTLQNVLIRQYRFPADIRRGDYVAEYWSHVVPVDPGNGALGMIRERTPLSGWFLVDDASDASFLAMCQKMVGRAFRATGGIAVRFTDTIGRPVIRLTVVGIYSYLRRFYNNNDGPHVLPAGSNTGQLRPLCWIPPGDWKSAVNLPNEQTTELRFAPWVYAVT